MSAQNLCLPENVPAACGAGGDPQALWTHIMCEHYLHELVPVNSWENGWTKGENDSNGSESPELMPQPQLHGENLCP